MKGTFSVFDTACTWSVEAGLSDGQDDIGDGGDRDGTSNDPTTLVMIMMKIDQKNYLVGPKIPATDDWTISHSFLLALKLSSCG